MYILISTQEWCSVSYSLWDRSVINQNENTDETTENVHQRYNVNIHQGHNEAIRQKNATKVYDALKPGEQPDELYGRLTAMKRRLEKHGEVISDANLTRRFVSAIERQEGNKYGDVITFCRGQMILNNPCNILNLREFLAYVHVSKSQVTDSPSMKGLASVAECSHCDKIGHNERECWIKHPEKRPGNPRPSRKKQPGKLSNTAWQRVMVGYSTQSPEWIILDPRSGKLRNAYSVTFNEGAPGFEPEIHSSGRLSRAVEVSTDARNQEPTAVEEYESSMEEGQV